MFFTCATCLRVRVGGLSIGRSINRSIDDHASAQSYHTTCIGYEADTCFKLREYATRGVEWRCIDCKSATSLCSLSLSAPVDLVFLATSADCELCASPGEDAKLLMCDVVGPNGRRRRLGLTRFGAQCDRGYHMFCLTPPMERVPQGASSSFEL